MTVEKHEVPLTNGDHVQKTVTPVNPPKGSLFVKNRAGLYTLTSKNTTSTMMYFDVKRLV
jgi:hypothetical protein